MPETTRGPAGGEPAAHVLAALDDLQCVDLTHPLAAAMPIFPGRNVLPFERRQTASLEEHGVAAGRFAMGEHQGTHIDAPSHFVASPLTADRIAVRDLIGAAVVLDITVKARADADYRLQPEDLVAWESQHGPIPAGAFVLVNSGWGIRWAEPGRYVNADEAGVPHHPGVAPSAAQRIVDRGARGIGVDTLSPDNSIPGSVRAETHKIVLGADRYVIENLAGLDKLPARDIVLFVGALPIVGGTAGPARVLAFHG